jgi:hypothetical protein
VRLEPPQVSRGINMTSTTITRRTAITKLNTSLRPHLLPSLQRHYSSTSASSGLSSATWQALARREYSEKGDGVSVGRSTVFRESRSVWIGARREASLLSPRMKNWATATIEAHHLDPPPSARS